MHRPGRGPKSEHVAEYPGVLHQGICKRILLERVRSRVGGGPAGLRSRGDIGPLDPDHGSDKILAVMDIVPPPSEDQVSRLQAIRAEHPDIEIASPADSRTALWPAY